MNRILSGSIDLKKIDKSKIVTTDKDGNPFRNGAKYLNVQIFVSDDPDQYGNHASLAINQTKEERESGNKKTYIGNFKEVWNSASNESPVQADVVKHDDELPF